MCEPIKSNQPIKSDINSNKSGCLKKRRTLVAMGFIKLAAPFS